MEMETTILQACILIYTSLAMSSSPKSVALLRCIIKDQGWRGIRIVHLSFWLFRESDSDHEKMVWVVEKDIFCVNNSKTTLYFEWQTIMKHEHLICLIFWHFLRELARKSWLTEGCLKKCQRLAQICQWQKCNCEGGVGNERYDV